MLRRAKPSICSIPVGLMLLVVSTQPSITQNQMAMISQGTLIVLVASRDGLVVASDSRQTLDAGLYCDDAEKLLVPAKPDRFVVAITGRRGFYPLTVRAHLHDICRYVKETPREFDLGELVRQYIETSDVDVDLRTLDVKKLAQHCQEALVGYLTTHPYNSPLALGFAFSSSVVLASYDPTSKRASIRTIEISVTPDLRQLVSKEGLNESFGLDDLAEPILCGEGDYLRQHVLPTIKDQPVSQWTIDQLGDFPKVNFAKVRDVELRNSISLAADLVSSASRMTERIPASSGIGGPIDVRIIGADARPARWPH